MELIFNELSFHGQFYDLASFRNAIDRLMAIRQMVRRFGRELQCHRCIGWKNATPDLMVQQAVRTLSIDKQRAFMQWVAKQGPFWEDIRQHSSDDWLQLKSDCEIVTDNAVGEAAFCLFHQISRGLISIDPSSWLFSPVVVEWLHNSETKSIDVPNFWIPERIQKVLESSPITLKTWNDLEVVARLRYANLTFSGNAFTPLIGHPFAKGAAERLLLRLAVLDELLDNIDQSGGWTPIGLKIYQEYFVGEKALFSDSTDGDKVRFKNELTFPHPNKIGESLFCTWHGKVKTPQLRIHFPWPMRLDEPFYVVYIGPKITTK